MRAVNLLPPDLRRAGAAGGSGSPVGAYALLAGLALAVALVALWASAGRQVKDREAEVARVNAEASAAEAQAANLAGYEGTVQIADSRRAAVVGLIENRIDWSQRLEDLSRTLPDDVWITNMAASAAPGVSVEGASGNPQRATVEAPAIELTGCTTSQENVARLMARLRSMRGVTSVALASSEKTESGGSTATSDSAAGAGTDCSQSSDQRPKFGLVVFYAKGAASAAPAEAGGAAPVAAAGASPEGGAK